MAKKKKGPDKLSQDVAAATASGLSYGQYMAIKGQTPPEPIAGLKACKYCGKLFKPRTTQVYCNDNCQYLARLEKKRKVK